MFGLAWRCDTAMPDAFHNICLAQQQQLRESRWLISDPTLGLFRQDTMRQKAFFDDREMMPGGGVRSAR